MKKQLFTTCVLLFAATVFTSVYCEAAKVPVATTIIEKAIMPTPVALVACPNGAISYLTTYHLGYAGGFATYIEMYKLAKIHWVVDETFYLTGYQALLNKTVSKLYRPPSGSKKDNTYNSTLTRLITINGKGATGRNPRDGLWQV